MAYHNEGFDAFQNGMDINSCPYRKGTDAKLYWELGWTEAQIYWEKAQN